MHFLLLFILFFFSTFFKDFTITLEMWTSYVNTIFWSHLYLLLYEKISEMWTSPNAYVFALVARCWHLWRFTPYLFLQVYDAECSSGEQPIVREWLWTSCSGQAASYAWDIQGAGNTILLFIDPSNAKATFIQSAKTQRFLKTM